MATIHIKQNRPVSNRYWRI